MKKEMQKLNKQKPEQKPNPMQESRKTFQLNGHWIEKPRKTEILTCACGTRYLKTRPHQNACLRCMFSPAKRVER
jgi:hypothetical protein